ncbi:hypothetical protein [Brevundimonas sp. GCM10030266]|uniref:hypothetical protein n=1 Tax=Brevundimonas sp. GCM10030266 TaxID=3273386 RepID=UPI0036140C69
MTVALSVAPVDGGWAVTADAFDNPMLFASGRAAERTGRDLALRLARAGREVQLDVRLRGGATAARFLCFPAVEQDAALMLGLPGLSSGPA